MIMEYVESIVRLKRCQKEFHYIIMLENINCGVLVLRYFEKMKLKRLAGVQSNLFSINYEVHSIRHFLWRNTK